MYDKKYSSNISLDNFRIGREKNISYQEGTLRIRGYGDTHIDINNNYISITEADDGDESLASCLDIDRNIHQYKYTGNGKYDDLFAVNDGSLVAKKISIYDGTSSQLLVADGSVAEFNKANGVPKLNASGKIDSSQVDALTNAEIDAIVI